jgi:hypothetical protein
LDAETDGLPIDADLDVVDDDDAAADDDAVGRPFDAEASLALLTLGSAS